MDKTRGWIGVDLDGTAAKYTGWVSRTHIGEPVPAMVARMKQWLDEGKEVRIFTARVYPLNQCVKPGDILPINETGNVLVDQAITAVKAIQQWCKLHVGQVLPVTNVKDYGMIVLFDDRAVQVVENTGELVGGTPKIKGH